MEVFMVTMSDSFRIFSFSLSLLSDIKSNIFSIWSLKMILRSSVQWICVYCWEVMFAETGEQAIFTFFAWFKSFGFIHGMIFASLSISTMTEISSMLANYSESWNCSLVSLTSTETCISLVSFPLSPIHRSSDISGAEVTLMDSIWAKIVSSRCVLGFTIAWRLLILQFKSTISLSCFRSKFHFSFLEITSKSWTKLLLPSIGSVSVKDSKSWFWRYSINLRVTAYLYSYQISETSTVRCIANSCLFKGHEGSGIWTLTTRFEGFSLLIGPKSCIGLIWSQLVTDSGCTVNGQFVISKSLRSPRTISIIKWSAYRSILNLEEPIFARKKGLTYFICSAMKSTWTISIFTEIEGFVNHSQEFMFFLTMSILDSVSPCMHFSSKLFLICSRIWGCCFAKVK